MAESPVPSQFMILWHCWCRSSISGLPPIRCARRSSRPPFCCGCHPNPSGLFDIKHDRGGIIDVEFMVQYLVLGHACDYPELTANIGNIALLKLAGKLGLIPVQTAELVLNAYREFRRMQHRLRLSGNSGLAGAASTVDKSQKFARVEADYFSDARAAVLQLWQKVFGV